MIAYGMLLGWPLVALCLFLTMPVGRATIWTILAGYLLLPVIVNIDYPVLPAFDKSSIPSLSALALVLMMSRRGEFQWPRSRTINALLLLYVLVPLVTSFNNTNPIVIGPTTLPSYGLKDGLATMLDRAILAIPFVLGAGVLRDEKSHRQLVMAFALAGIAYSLPILLEIRLSPFLQTKLYGVIQQGYFAQQMRSGGFRSMVFLGHGLLVSTFCAMALIATIGLARMRMQIFSIPAGLFAGYLALVLLLNKSLAAILFVAVVAGLFLGLRRRAFLSAALAIAVVIFLYPMVRTADVLPLRSAVQQLSVISAERSRSMEFRLANEDMLLERAWEKPFFGWGGYGRNRVIVETPWGTTADLTVTDGTWVLAIGIYGLVGYFALFGLLTYPFWHVFTLRRFALPVSSLTLLAMHLVNLLDLIPNSSLRPITWMIAGALATMTVARARAPVAAGSRTKASRGGMAAGEPALQN
ncbi:O-antigen ligase family protein [Sphingobium sp. SYK-6]|uniref:O-antigen ligase family protein n=1 Tax=Sphingobium sp. (strain NBRC 103272 / SYK-6) TaxID=627192 RepID=UPI000685121E|nr:O-antigen ligase family protein [Sphingobium sp. SYK-6]